MLNITFGFNIWRAYHSFNTQEQAHSNTVSSKLQILKIFFNELEESIVDKDLNVIEVAGKTASTEIETKI